MFCLRHLGRFPAATILFKLNPLQHVVVQSVTSSHCFGPLRSICNKDHSFGKPVLTLFTKNECSLCDDAKIILEKYKHRYKFEEVYITEKGNEQWYKEYKYDIPVFHLNGSFLMKHRVNEALLEQQLKKLENSQKTNNY